jgi:hypothetical protein
VAPRSAATRVALALCLLSVLLAVAALFQPARRRVQQAVDLRFNRRKYDAARTIDRFSARLRDQIDLDTLSAELLAVVDHTMRPTATSLWLRPSVSDPAPVPPSARSRPGSFEEPDAAGSWATRLAGRRSRWQPP